MAKALVSIVNTDIDEGQVRLIYSVVLLGPPHFKYGSDYPINTSVSLEKNIIALKDKIAVYAGEKGARMSTGDVIIFGAPVVKDDISFKSETQGITSDSTAVAKELVAPAEEVATTESTEEPGLFAKITQTVKDWFA